MQRHRQPGLVEALVIGRVQHIERAARPQTAASEEAPRAPVVQERPPNSEPPEPPPLRRRNARWDLIDALASPAALRHAILLQEILGPPKALRQDYVSP
jgi:hypothetical protein